MIDVLEVSPLRKRIIVVGFILVLVGAGFLNSVVKRHDLAGIQGQNAATSVVALTAKASSSAWYCPGPLALGHRGEQAAISITNLSTNRLSAEMHVATNSGSATNTTEVLSPEHESVLALPQPKHPTYGAVTVVVDGPGVGVNEIIRTSSGTATSPCTTHTSDHAYFGIGSTAGSSNMAVSLYNPGATPAVASLAFTSGSSTTTPATFTSVPVEPGQVVVLFAGHALPQRNAFSATVSTLSGQIAVGALDFKDVNSILSLSLRVGMPVTQSSWWFAPTVVAPAIHQTFALVNTSQHRETIDLRFIGTGANGTVSIVIGPGATELYNAPTARAPGIEAASVAVAGRGSVIAEREIMLGRHLSTSHAERGTQLPNTLPPGFVVTQANAARATTWLIAGGRSDAVASEVIAVANPQDVPVTISLNQVVNGNRLPVPGAASLVIGAHNSASVDLSSRVHGRSAIVIEVQASRQVLAGATEYGRSTQGLSAPAPLPVR